MSKKVLGYFVTVLNICLHCKRVMSEEENSAPVARELYLPI